MNEQNTKPGVRVIKVESRFARMALREGGISADSAIAAATAFVDDQRARYFDWVTADLLALDAQVSALHDKNGDDASHRDAAYYKAAQIRDLGGTFGYQVITETADSLCELLYRFKAAGRYSREALDTHMGAMKMVCARDVESMSPAVRQMLLEGLHKVVEKFPRPQPPADRDNPAS